MFMCVPYQSAYLSAILRSYDNEISEVKATVNNARMWHSDLPNLVNQRFDAETSFALLCKSKIVMALNLKSNWIGQKCTMLILIGRNIQFMCIFIQKILSTAETSLMERILIDPSPVIEYKFLYGDAANSKTNAQLEYNIKYFRRVEIDFSNDFCSTESSERPFHNVVYGEVIIRNLPEFEGRQVTKIEVKSSSIGIYEKQPFIIEAQKGTDKSKNIFITNTYQDLRFPLTVTPIEFEPAEKYPLFQHKLTYPTLASTSICYENMKALIQFEESDGEEALCWRYNFEKGLKNDGIGMGEEKAKMIDLYKTYLEERSDITNVEHIPDISSNADDIRVNIDAYALSLQMVDMKKIGKN